MNLRRLPFLGTVSVRLAVAYTALFAVFSGALLAYLYYTTVGHTQYVADQRVNAELDSIQRAYRDGGLPRVNQSLIERASIPDRYFLYQLSTPTGIKLSGDLSGMPAEGTGRVNFPIDAQRPDGSFLTVRAEGRIVRLGEEALLLVAFDARERGEVTRQITRAVWVAAGIALALAVLGGVLTSRYVNRRVEELASTTEAVMGGDLARRAQLRNRNGDEFDRLADHLNTMLDRLERLVKASRHTGDSIAHDLKSPLSRLRNRLESALARPVSGEAAQETLGETLTEVDRVLATFNAILRLSRIDTHASARLIRTDVCELVVELADLFEPAAEAVGLSFAVERPKSAIVLGDREMIAQALSNLIDNAIKYTPDDGAIAVSVKKDKDEAVITVLDTGPGIPEQARARVVERFVRMDSARTQPGSGLGLALVEAVADVHRGHFELLDGKGPPDRPGLRAVLRLPLA